MNINQQKWELPLLDLTYFDVAYFGILFYSKLDFFKWQSCQI